MRIPRLSTNVPRARLLAVLGLLLLPVRPLVAAEAWIEVKTAHFTVWSAAGDRNAITMAWQMEQLRSVMAALWPWASVDLARPVQIFVVKDEQAMRAMAPEYWERRGDMRPATVWVSGRDQHYMVLRADVRADDTSQQNPYASSYFSYAHLVISSSFDRELPPWFSRGLAGVLSNTIVRDDQIRLGPPIPWHLETLRDGRRIPLAQLMATKRSAPELRQGDVIRRFDAEAWAFVHYLMFGDNGAHQAGLNRLAVALNAGKDPAAAFTESLGRVENLEADFFSYVQRNVFSYARAKLDAGIKREQLPARPLPAAESASGRAAFQVAMGRPVEARALIDEARKADANAAGVSLAEALLLDREGQRDDARSAYGRAVTLGTGSAWAHYRLATLEWAGSRPDQGGLQRIEQHLSRAVELHPSFAAAYASLAEVRAALGQPQADVLPLLRKAITLEPGEPWHRLVGARVLWRYGAAAEARRIAEEVRAGADSEEARREAERLLAEIPKAP
jgi:tetratricopeptide (TPR) repeat protein